MISVDHDKSLICVIGVKTWLFLALVGYSFNTLLLPDYIVGSTTTNIDLDSRFSGPAILVVDKKLASEIKGANKCVCIKTQVPTCTYLRF